MHVKCPEICRHPNSAPAGEWHLYADKSTGILGASLLSATQRERSFEVVARFDTIFAYMPNHAKSIARAFMFKYFRNAFVVLTLTVLAVSAATAGDKVITLEQLNQMFADMRAELNYKKWNVDGDLLWGYFFTDREAKKLHPVADHLTKAGYRLVNIYPTDDKTKFFLHVERIEHHTPESLDRRNQEFYKLADHYHIESYDGMDVGPLPVAH
jgi:hypothetical protein